jgi:hypothetical protein
MYLNLEYAYLPNVFFAILRFIGFDVSLCLLKSCTAKIKINFISYNEMCNIRNINLHLVKDIKENKMCKTCISQEKYE